MSGRVDEFECDIPCWAVCAIEYCDYSGLSDEDEKTLNDWESSLKRDGMRWEICFTSDVNEFNPHPEFGLACATCKAVVSYYEC